MVVEMVVLKYRRQYIFFSIQGKYDASGSTVRPWQWGKRRVSGRTANRNAARQRSTDAHQSFLDPGLSSDAG